MIGSSEKNKKSGFFGRSLRKPFFSVKERFFQEKCLTFNMVIE